MVLIHIFRGYTITNLILDSNSVIFTSSIKSLIIIGTGSKEREPPTHQPKTDNADLSKNHPYKKPQNSAINPNRSAPSSRFSGQALEERAGVR